VVVEREGAGTVPKDWRYAVRTNPQFVKSRIAPEAVTYEVEESRSVVVEDEGVCRIERDDAVEGVAERGLDVVEEVEPGASGAERDPRIHEPAVERACRLGAVLSLTRGLERPARLGGYFSIPGKMQDSEGCGGWVEG